MHVMFGGKAPHSSYSNYYLYLFIHFFLQKQLILMFVVNYYCQGSAIQLSIYTQESLRMKLMTDVLCKLLT